MDRDIKIEGDSVPKIDANGRQAACVILNSICQEIENGSFLEKRSGLEQMLSQAEPAWFDPLSSDERPGGGEAADDMKEAVCKTILLLLTHTQSLLTFSKEEEAEVVDSGSKRFKQHAKLAHSALSIISILLCKLQEASKTSTSEDERGHPSKLPPANKTALVPLKDGVTKDADGGKLLQEKIGMCSLEEKEKDVEEKEEEEERKRLGKTRMTGIFSIPPQSDNIFQGEVFSPDLEHHLGSESGCDDNSGGDDLMTCPGASSRSLRAVLKAVSGACIVLCAAHAQDSPWTNAKCRQTSKVLLSQLTKMCGHASIASFLRGNQHEKQQGGTKAARVLLPKGGFSLAVGELRQKLTRKDWKKHPAAKHSFVWLLGQMKHPYLGEHLDSCLPPSLLLVDDYKAENKILGIRCLHHIINQVDPTELRWYGRADVVYEALHPLLHNHEPHLIDALYPCLLSLLGVVERDPKRVDKPRQLGKYDKALQVILTNMEGEQRVAVRQANARHLGPYIEAMGTTILWHMKRLLRVVTSYLEESDGSEETGRILALRILQTVILQAWPRISSHCAELMKCIIRLVVDLSGRDDISPEVLEILREESIRCLVLLKRSSGAVVEDSINKVLSSDLTNVLLEQCFREVLGR